MMLPVTYVTFVTKNVTFVTFVTPKNVTLFLNFYLRALKKILTPWKNNLTPRKKKSKSLELSFSRLLDFFSRLLDCGSSEIEKRFGTLLKINLFLKRELPPIARKLS